MKRKNGKIELLRFIMALIIMIYHLQGISAAGHYRGALGVEFFFLVSGYFMASSCANKKDPFLSVGRSTANFIAKKYKTICPYLWCSGIMALIIDMMLAPVTGKRDFLVRLFTMFNECLGLPQTGLRMYTLNSPIWYISAMFIAMMILYPLCYKNFDVFSHITAPLTGFMIIGMIYVALRKLNGPNDVVLMCVRKGLIRGIAEICLGVVIYNIADAIRHKAGRITSLGRYGISFVEFFAYFIAIYLMNTRKETKYDVMILYLLMLGLIFSFSEAGAFANIFNNRVFYSLGSFSLPIYLTHYNAVKIIKTFQPDYFKAPLLPYCLLCFALSSVLYLLVRLVKKFEKPIRGLFIAEPERQLK